MRVPRRRKSTPLPEWIGGGIEIEWIGAQVALVFGLGLRDERRTEQQAHHLGSPSCPPSRPPRLTDAGDLHGLSEATMAE